MHIAAITVASISHVRRDCGGRYEPATPATIAAAGKIGTIVQRTIGTMTQLRAAARSMLELHV